MTTYLIIIIKAFMGKLPTTENSKVERSSLKTIENFNLLRGIDLISKKIIETILYLDLLGACDDELRCL